MRLQLLRCRFVSGIPSSDMAYWHGGQHEAMAYVDDKRRFVLTPLATIAAARIVELKYLDQSRAGLFRSPGQESGVIEITTVDKRK